MPRFPLKFDTGRIHNVGRRPLKSDMRAENTAEPGEDKMKKAGVIGMICRGIAATLLCVIASFLLLSCEGHPISLNAEYSAEGGAVYESDHIESLRGRITVKALDMFGNWTEVDDYEISGELSSGECELTVTYGELSDSFTVVVTAVEPVGLRVDYEQTSAVSPGASLDILREDLTVTVINNDGSEQRAVDFQLSGELVGGECEVTVTFGGLSASFTVNVAAASPLEIRADFEQRGAVYSGDSLDTLKSRLTVTVVYSDGTERLADDFVLSGKLSSAESEITVECMGLFASFTVDVTAVVPSSLVARYSGGELSPRASLDYIRENLEVMLKYNNGTKRTVNDYELSGELSLGNSVITISHSGLELELTVTVVDVIEINGMTLEYSEEKGGYCVVEYTGRDSSVIVPASCGGGVPVVGVGTAFSKSNITEITLPESILELLPRAFLGCASLERVNIPSVSEIGERTFYGCASLLSVEIPASVLSIGKYAFYGCGSLRALCVADGGGLRSIGESAFSTCSSLASIDFGENSSLETIERAAFYGVKGLLRLEIPASLSRIGSAAFENCSGLSRLTVADNGALVSIGAHAFNACASLEAVDFGENSILSDIGEFAFAGCASLAAFELPGSLRSLGEAAFEKCTSLSAFTVAAGNASFSALDGVLYSGDGKTLICYPAAAPAEEFQIPSGVEKIGSYAFSFSQNARSVVIPESVFSIGIKAFEYSAALAEMTIPDSVTDLGNSAFFGASALSAVSFGAGSQLSILKAYMFVECVSLKTVNLPASLVGIGPYAFAYCTSLSSITIPSRVTVIADGAFSGCEKLSSVEFEMPYGWGLATSQDGADWRQITALSDKAKNARWLREDYSAYYWLRA